MNPCSVLPKGSSLLSKRGKRTTKQHYSGYE
jgi:hypothetical protein